MAASCLLVVRCLGTGEPHTGVSKFKVSKHMANTDTLMVLCHAGPEGVLQAGSSRQR